MKTKTIFLLCLLLGLGSAQLFAQNEQNGTGTDVYDFEVTWVSKIPVICDGQLLDLISTPMGLICEVRDHYNKGNWVWEISLANNYEFTSDLTGEIFIGHGAYKDRVLLEEGKDYFQVNLKGNMGSHYIIQMVYDIFNNWEIIEVHANCH